MYHNRNVTVQQGDEPKEEKRDDQTLGPHQGAYEFPQLSS